MEQAKAWQEVGVGPLEGETHVQHAGAFEGIVRADHALRDANAMGDRETDLFRLIAEGPAMPDSTKDPALESNILSFEWRVPTQNAAALARPPPSYQVLGLCSYHHWFRKRATSQVVRV